MINAAIKVRASRTEKSRKIAGIEYCIEIQLPRRGEANQAKEPTIV